MRRHLTRAEALAAVRRGAGVAQFLGFADPVDDERTLRYVVVSGTNPVHVCVCHKFDVGNGEFADLVEFPEVDAWDPIDEEGRYRGEDPSIVDFEEPEQALEWAEESHGATDSRWVNESMIGDEYLDAFHALR